MKSILVIGAGKFGTHLALDLYKLGNEVMLVDRDEAKINEISHLVRVKCGVYKVYKSVTIDADGHICSLLNILCDLEQNIASLHRLSVAAENKLVKSGFIKLVKSLDYLVNIRLTLKPEAVVVRNAVTVLS